VTQQDFQDMKRRWYEYLVNDVKLKVSYRSLAPSSTVNQRFGILENEETSDVLLYANVIVRPSDKVKRKWGVESDTTLIAALSTYELENSGISIERETGAVVYEGTEYEIVNIDCRPLMFGSSVMTVLACRERKPLNE
jgi:hypothetical protein